MLHSLRTPVPDCQLSVFNISDTAQTVHYVWRDLGLSAPGYRLRDLWTHTDLGSATSVEITLPPHASVLYRAAPTTSEEMITNSERAPGA